MHFEVYLELKPSLYAEGLLSNERDYIILQSCVLLMTALNDRLSMPAFVCMFAVAYTL